ncbi:unnamed protein product [Hermetia illucens]|uniref:CCHC-type domain-containing protein n=1 Tax=Hermetia illucens TaxID=343691 RepID=A0A7R8UFZ7_HERIL|nr:unnamed protein product [Hermetia illucens]
MPVQPGNDGRLSGHTEKATNSAEDTWTKVGPKKKLQKRARPDALIITKTSELTYAEILRKVKADASLTDLSANVTRIRRTQKGDLLFELKTGDDGGENLRKKIEASLGEAAAVKMSKDSVVIECKDLDEVTTKSEICEALQTQLGLQSVSESNVLRLRKAYGDTQIASISLPIEAAKKAIAVGKVRIGWVVCRLREQSPVHKCDKCWQVGHIAKACTSSQDRSNLCRKCGEQGHLAKDCNGMPKCVFCVEAKSSDSAHIAGSSKCPVFRKTFINKAK